MLHKNQCRKIVGSFEGYLGMLDEENLDIKEENFKLKNKLKKLHK